MSIAMRFVGGISKNYNSNLILSGKSRITVVEADEYDRSSIGFAKPVDSASITSADPDILDYLRYSSAYRVEFLPENLFLTEFRSF